MWISLYTLTQTSLPAPAVYGAERGRGFKTPKTAWKTPFPLWGQGAGHLTRPSGMGLTLRPQINQSPFPLHWTAPALSIAHIINDVNAM